MSTLHIALATPDDLPRIVDLVESAYRGDRARAGWTHEADLIDGQRTDLGVITAVHADPAQRLLVARRIGMDGDDGIIGTVTVSARDEGVCYLGMLAVDPQRQAAGTGRALIDAAERIARDDLGASTVEMTVIGRRIDLIAYYQRRGYALTGETRPFPYDDRSIGEPLSRDLDFVVLARSL